MTIYDIIQYRAQQIIMAIMRERYPLHMSIDDVDAMLWAESEKIANDVLFNNFR